MSDDADELEGLGWEALESAADTSDPEVAAAYLELANAAAHESRRARRLAVQAQEDAEARAEEERRAAVARRREEEGRKQDERRAQEAKRQADERRAVEARARASTLPKSGPLPLSRTGPLQDRDPVLSAAP